MNIKYRRDLYQLLPVNANTCEVGVAEGLFSADILSWNLGTHYMVDAWQHMPGNGDKNNDQDWHDANMLNAVRLATPYKARGVFLRGISWEMARRIPDDSLYFVNIDCDHSYKAVMADIAAYWPKLKNGGVMAFHDYEMPQYGVKFAVRDSFPDKEIFSLPEDAIKDAGAYVIK
jgi:hypothetical protein